MPEPASESKRRIVPITAAAIIALILLATAMAWRVGDDETSADSDDASSETTDTPRTTLTTPTTTAPAEWTVLWSDEFDDDSLDPVWTPYHSTYGDGNNELQCHTPDNVSEKDGVLDITARRGEYTCPNGETRDFTSGFISTRDTDTYFPAEARYEIRAKVPHGQGLWPAFWLRHRDGSAVVEVDVMEYLHSQVPGKTTQSLHFEHTNRSPQRSTAFEETDTSDWHVWAVEITEVPNGMRFDFFTDDELTLSFTDTDPEWAEAHDPDLIFDLAINLSIGGNWVGDPDGELGELPLLERCAQGGIYPGACADTDIVRAEFDAHYVVDWVRVLTK